MVAGVPPLAYLVEQIGAEHVKVDVLVQPGQDPHTFEPTPQQIVALAHAAVFFKIDMPFETVLLEKVREGNPRLRIVDATRGVKKRPWMPLAVRKGRLGTTSRRPGMASPTRTSGSRRRC